MGTDVQRERGRPEQGGRVPKLPAGPTPIIQFSGPFDTMLLFLRKRLGREIEERNQGSPPSTNENPFVDKVALSIHSRMKHRTEW